MLACLSRLHRIPSLFDGAVVFLDTGNAVGALVVAAAPVLRCLRVSRSWYAAIESRPRVQRAIVHVEALVPQD